MSKVLICGSRNYNDMWAMGHFIYGLPEGTIIVEGGARGADTLAREYAERRGLEVREYPARWAEFGRRAGPLRNAEMLKKEHPDKVVAFTKDFGASRGTQDMVKRARQAGILVEVRP